MDTGINLSAIVNNLSSGSYPLLGSGSGRRVYDLHNGTVLKAAKNVKGYAQNQIEAIISEMDDSDLFAKVLFISSDNRYLIMEKADPVTDFSEILNYFHVKTIRELFQLNNFNYIPRKYNLLISDLRRPVNWGMLQGRPVIIDYGFTGRIRRKYYSIF
ncbi:MAG TPA: hypothetical protein DCZ40_06120 [Lachnospiraceae bacterium]|nr:hypothetical protein [Lachnospiraceae bacterium]